MNKFMNCLKVLIVIGLFIFLTPNASAAEEWSSNSSIVTGLGDEKLWKYPTVFYTDNTWKYITMTNSGGCYNYGFEWNTSTSQWDSNATLVNGLLVLGNGYYLRPTVYNDSGTLKLITGIFYGDFKGYQWNGTGWASTPSIINGLGNVGGHSAPTVFNDAGTWKLIAGNETGEFTGFQWNGASWVSNSSIVAGLGDVGTHSAPDVYYQNGTWKLIAGETGAVFNGFEWNGTGWESNPSIVARLGGVSTYTAPAVFNDSGNWKLISGGNSGAPYGFELLPTYTVSGTLTSSTGSPIVGAEVTIDSISNTTNATGYYTISRMFNDTHAITATASGYIDHSDSVTVSGNTIENFVMNKTLWSSNSSLVTGLPVFGWYLAPTFFNDAGTWKLIAGDGDGDFYGYQWNGTGWESNSSLVTGLEKIEWEPKPTVFYDSGWKMITGIDTGVFYGFQWNGTGWESNSSLVAGLGDIGDYSAPDVYYDSGTWKLIAGNSTGYFTGFQWNGTGWESNSSLVGGLGDVGRYSAPAVFNDSGTWKLISGERYGGLYGYQWNGTSWVSNPSLVTGLGGIAGESKPTVFYDSGWKLIAGDVNGAYYGFEILAYTVSGTVTNSTGSPIVGAEVTVDGNSNTTNATGYYAISNILFNTYSITATASGYSPYTGSVTVSGDTTKDFAMIETSNESLNFTVTINNVQNTALLSTNTSFGSVASGSTIIIADSFNLTNTGNVIATVNAKFTTLRGTTYGLNGTTDVIGGANFSMTAIYSDSYCTLSSINSDTSIAGSNVAADAIADIWKVRLVIPAGQVTDTYTGTVQLTFSNA